MTIAQEQIDFTGKTTWAMTVNGGIPGPTLRFQEGDFARIKVHNKMDVDTSIHWHGLLVPPGMDGVPYISFPPIAPGTTFVYEFPIRQSGTYWYHSHTMLQEQRGVYGSIVIEPPQKRFQVDRDYVILLSDWSDEDPHAILKTLKRGSEWYAMEKGSGQSIIGAAMLGMFGDYFTRELQRMPAMDIADVAYDRFLVNGKPEVNLTAEPGDTVRLRIIDGSATTFFHLEFSGGPMEIITADGIDVEPLKMQRFLIGVAETYDVLIKIPEKGAYEFRATAHDASGFTSVKIGDGVFHPAPDVPHPNLYHAMGNLSLKNIFAFTPAGSMDMPDRAVEAGEFDKPGSMMSMHSMGGMEGMDHSMGQGEMDHSSEGKGKGEHDSHGESDMKHGSSDMTGMQHDEESMSKMIHQDHKMMEMHHSKMKKSGHQVNASGKKFSNNFLPLASDVSSSENLAMDGMGDERPWPPYKQLRATQKTAFDQGKTVRDIRLTLDGDMERYVWFINKKALSESDSILIREGEIVRFIMINRTMMHHPMHLHGHFFRVINGQGDYSPLKHTVDVAPMSTTVIEFDANEPGDWFFHCHLLYHMESGMTRVVHYDKFTPPQEVTQIRPTLYNESWYFWGQAEILSSMTEGFITIADTRNNLTFEWEVGWQEVDETEWEGIFIWDRYFNRFFSIFAGADILGEESEIDHTRVILGIHYLMPFLIETRLWVDSDSGARISFEKEFAITPRFSLMGEAEYDTHESGWEGKAALNYSVCKNISLTGQWHSDFYWGGGLIVNF
ncbi:MAG: multicopper oxidase domain-containing protein [Proteobacteria bacterium]|nr:multicopper oxidase domain-containing protein [Pseudomonadota bacterium]MBU1711144.1 multicopper oxidase domain-containing protein [Pseudomonadota bacterium]